MIKLYPLFDGYALGEFDADFRQRGRRDAISSCSSPNRDFRVCFHLELLVGGPVVFVLRETTSRTRGKLLPPLESFGDSPDPLSGPTISFLSVRRRHVRIPNACMYVFPASPRAVCRSCVPADPLRGIRVPFRYTGL